MNFKLSGQLPLTSFFSPSGGNRSRRKENARPIHLGAKRKRGVFLTHPEPNSQEPPAKKRKETIVLEEFLPQESSIKPNAIIRRSNQELALRLNKGPASQPDTSSSIKPLLPTPHASSPVAKFSYRRGLENKYCQSTTPRTSFLHDLEGSTIVSNDCLVVKGSSANKGALPTPPATSRPNRKIVSLLSTLDSTATLSGNDPIPWQTPETSHCPISHRSSTTTASATSCKRDLPASNSLGATGNRQSSSPSSAADAAFYCANTQREWTEACELDGLLEPISKDFVGDPFAAPALSQMIVPSSQSLDIRFPFPVPSSQVAPPAPLTENSPVFSLPTLPNDTRKVPNMFDPTASSRSEEMFVPSSQTQCMTLCDIPCDRKERQPTHSDTLLLDRRRTTLTLGEIVQSSQSQLERTLTLSRGISQIFSRGSLITEGFGTSDQSCIDPNADQSMVSKTCVSEALLPEAYEILQTPDSSLRSPSLSHTYISPLQIPSGVGATFESDGEEISTLPSPLRIFRDMFDDEPGWLLEGDSFSVSGTPIAEHADSATESESENDVIGRDDLLHDCSESDAMARGQRSIDNFQHTPEPSRRKYSASHHRSYGISSIPSSDSFEADLATSPVCVPADLTLSTDAEDSYSSMGSLPSPLKEFRDMFEESGSWPTDFLSSLKS